MKLLVTGGRKYTDWVRVQRVLDAYLEEWGRENLILIEGGAEGADRLARKWAQARGVHVATVDALWDWFRGKGNALAAGPARNRAMTLLDPDHVVAFPGNTGTRNMVEQARQAGISVHEVVN